MQDFLVGSSAVNSNKSGCLGDLVRVVQKFEVHVVNPN